MPDHRSRGRATLPATLTPAPERRTAVADRSPSVSVEPCGMAVFMAEPGGAEQPERTGAARGRGDFCSNLEFACA